MLYSSSKDILLSQRIFAHPIYPENLNFPWNHLRPTPNSQNKFHWNRAITTVDIEVTGIPRLRMGTYIQKNWNSKGILTDTHTKFHQN